MNSRAAIALSVLLLASCAGSRARGHVLWPIFVGSTWPGVAEQLDRAPDLGIAVGDVEREQRYAIEAAIAADDYSILPLSVSALVALHDRVVDARVDAQEVSAGVGVSLKMRAMKFSEVHREFTK